MIALTLTVTFGWWVWLVPTVLTIIFLAFAFWPEPKRKYTGDYGFLGDMLDGAFRGVGVVMALAASAVVWMIFFAILYFTK